MDVNSRPEVEAAPAAEVLLQAAPAAVVAEEEEVTDHMPGFRFHPTDEELVGFYLRRKVEKKPMRMEIIKQVDIYKYDPWDLPRVSNVGDKEWYFFCPRGRKYRNSVRPNRVTGSGFWKATGIDRPIYAGAGSCHGCDVVGLKKSLVYYRGSAGKGLKTDWMMHEFRLPVAAAGCGVNNSCSTTMPEAGETWTICRIFNRNVSYKRQQAQAQSWRSSDTSAKQAPSCGLSSKTCSGAAESNSITSDDGGDGGGGRQLQVRPASSSSQRICDNNSVVVTGGGADQGWENRERIGNRFSSDTLRNGGIGPIRMGIGCKSDESHGNRANQFSPDTLRYVPIRPIRSAPANHGADKPQVHADHQLHFSWNSSASHLSTTQSPSPVSYDVSSCFPAVQSQLQTVNEFLLRSDGISWEELGRMAEFSGDPPFPVYECRY